MKSNPISDEEITEFCVLVSRLRTIARIVILVPIFMAVLWFLW